MGVKQADSEAVLAERVMNYRDDPLGFVLFAFPWGEEGTPLEFEKGPRAWQAKVLEQVGAAIRTGEVPDLPFLMAAATGHGTGKSALTAWIILWAMSTMKDTKGVVTASTEQQLRTKTWSELAKWHNMAINSHWFRYTATKLCFAEPEAEETWKIDAVTWSEENTIAFQGLHNKGRRLLVIFDEASGISDGIWEVTEGALTDEDTEIFWFAFGNPNKNTGRFDACWKLHRNAWKRRVRLDSRNVEGANLKQIRLWEDLYGADSDFFRVRVCGLPPKGAGGNLISLDDVEKAMERDIQKHQYEFAPLVIGVDPAWTGEDTFEIVARQGMKCWLLHTMPKNDDDVRAANLIAEFEDRLNADAVFIDAGYGTGIYSIGRSQNRNWKNVWFSGKTNDEECVNKRAEMWKSMRDWIREGGCLPRNEDLKVDLISVDRKPRDDGKIQLQSKEEMRKELKASPGKGDALALTFAEKILTGETIRELGDIDYESDWEDW